MGKPGGGRGTNQHQGKGAAKARPGPVAAESEVVLPPVPGLFDPLNQPYGATPVDEESRDHLLPEHRGIRTLAELNALEAANIARGLLWLRTEGLETDDLLDQFRLREVHQRMFGDVWTWAGALRLREMTIGIAPHQIQKHWKAALDDTAWHIEHRTWSPAETVLRLHHRTVLIHPFVNGNGRHARLMADELAESLGLGTGAFSWGRHRGLDTEELRREYLVALRRIDTNRNDLAGLVKFALDPSTVDEWSD